MPDNVDSKVAANVPVATDVVTYSGDADQNVQLMRMVQVTGAEGSKTVVDLPGDATNGLAVNVTKLPGAALDTFGKVQVVSSINDIDVQFFRDAPANLVNITATGGTASSTTVPGAIRLSTGAGATNAVRAVSRDTVMYRSGGEVFVLFTAAFLTGGVVTSAQRVGLFDDNNGFFFGYENTTLGLTVRTGAADTQVALASFNGELATKFTRAGTIEAVNYALLNVYRIRFGWLGAAPVKLEILSPDGEWVLMHVIKQPNLSAAPSIQSTDLPMCAQLVKTAGATDIQMNTACWGAGLTYTRVDVAGSATLAAAANSVVNYNTQGIGTFLLRVGTTPGSGTIIVEATIDGTNWITHPQCWLLGAAGTADVQVTAAFTATSGNAYRVNCAGFRGLRVRVATLLGSTCVLHANGESNATVVNVVPQPASATMNASSSDGGTALTSTAQAIKASPGTLDGYYIYNPNATAQFVQFYNTASGGVTVGTTNPLLMLTIPAASAANLSFVKGVLFSTAMSWAATSTAGGNGAPATALDAVCWYT